MSENKKDILSYIGHVVFFTILCFTASYLGKYYESKRQEVFFVTLSQQNRDDRHYSEQMLVIRARNGIEAFSQIQEEVLPKKSKEQGEKWVIYDMKKL